MRVAAITMSTCLAALLCGAPRQAMTGEAKDPCGSIPLSESRVSLMLKDVRLSKEGFFGTFVLSNVRLDSKLVLVGKRDNGVFWPTDPSISVQFLDLNGRWVSFPSLAGSFISPDRLEVDVHSREFFTVGLMSQEVANRSSSDFRILVRTFQPAICIISRAFHGVPRRPPVTSFE
jgi:hypothetical protein